MSDVFNIVVRVCGFSATCMVTVIGNMSAEGLRQKFLHFPQEKVCVDTKINFHAQPRNQGGSRGSDEPPILTGFVLEPAICINTQQ